MGRRTNWRFAVAPFWAIFITSLLIVGCLRKRDSGGPLDTVLENCRAVRRDFGRAVGQIQQAYVPMQGRRRPFVPGQQFLTRSWAATWATAPACIPREGSACKV